ncbi:MULTISPECIES: hypothetical protein [unclassified Microbacterium]|uniref:hypothetical protein n=1 Tax=unclassified Microbacterium TaxID=2609290 RepID=UPI003C2CD29F
MTDDPVATPLPRSVLVVDNQLYREISESPESVDLLDNLDAMVIPYSAKAEVNVAEVTSIRRLLLDAGQLAPGSLLVKNPYTPATYEPADLALEAFALAKYHALANVAKHLGATKVSFVDAQVDNAESSWNVAAKAKTPAAKADLQVSREVTQKIAKKLHGEMTFDGAAPDIDSALESLRVRNLMSDQQLRYLIELRTGTNPIASYKMTLSGTRESSANLRSALNLVVSVPKSGDGSASFTKVVNTISNIDITTEITF